MVIETFALALLAGAPVAAPAEVAWQDGGLSATVGLASRQEKPVLIYFWMDGSEYCGKLWVDSLSAPATQDALSRFVCHSAKHGTPQANQLFELFGVRSTPAMVFLLPDGSPEDMIGGYIGPEELVSELARIERGENTVRGLRKAVEAAEKGTDGDFQARLALADRLEVLGQGEERHEIMASIRLDDPDGVTPTGARVALMHVSEEIAAQGGGEEEMASWNLEPLKKHLVKVRHDEVLYEGWLRIGQIEAARSNVAGACEGFRAAWKVVPEEGAMDFAADVASYIMEADGERSKKEKKLAVDLAESASELAAEYEGCGGGCVCDTCTDLDGFRAGRVALLARAYSFYGDKRKALKTAKRCIELDPDGEYEQLVAAIEKGELGG